MIGFCYNSKRVELYDPSQARDESGKWTGSGGGASIPSEPQAKHDEASKTPVVYHGTSAEVLKNIREKGLRASRSGVWGKGVYATSSMETALEYGALKSTSSARIMGKSLIGLIEVASSGFKKVSEYNADSKRHGRKASGVIEILLSDKDVPSSMIKSMKIFDAKAVRNWIFEGGEQPKPLATKNLQEGSIFVPIIIDESETELGVDYTGTPKDSCPIATQDIKTNLKNRAHAVEDAAYGPANPKEPNEEFWTKMAKNFNTTAEEAKTMRCGNCAAFNKTSRLLNCIKKGIGEDAEEVAKAGDLGFCEFFDFKCASLRTCSAWVVGGPITDKEEKQEMDCGTGSGGFKEGNTCARGSDKTAYHGTLASYANKIKKEGLKASWGVAGKGVYATDEISAIDWALTKFVQTKNKSIEESNQNSKIAIIGLIPDKFKSVGMGSVLSEEDISPSYIKSVKIMSIKDAQKRISEYKRSKYGFSVKNKEAIYIGLLLDSELGKNLESQFQNNFTDIALNCGTGAGGFKAGNTCSKGGGESKGKLEKFVEKVKKENPKADIASEAVRAGANAIIKGVRGAVVAGKYGISKTSDIVKWLRSDDGNKFLKATGETLRVIGGGAIGAIRGVHNARFKIFVGVLINPAVVPYLVSASATKGMFDGAIREYRGQGHGRDISNAIREKIGVKPMQAYVQSIKLQAKEPPLEDVVAYLTDVLRVSIDEAIDGKERFEVVSFFDPNQERDESGKWTSGGGGTAESKIDPQRVGEIENNLKVSAYGPEPVRGKEEKEELKVWATSLAKNEYTPMEATQVVNGLKAYASANPLQVGGFRQVNKFLRGKDIPQMQLYGVYKTLSALQVAFQGGPKNKEDVVYRGSKSDAGAGNMNKSYTHNIAKYIKVGATLSNKGFFSATKSDSIADEFAGGMLKKSNPMITQSQIFMKLSKARGKGISMPLFAGIGREKEVLFPEKTKIKVTKVNRIEHETPAYWANRGVPKTYSTFIEGEIQ